MSSQFIFDPTNLLVLPSMIVGNFVHGDWKGSYQRSGPLGVAAELAQSAIGTNTYPFFIPTESGWQFQDIQALLLRHGIKVWAVGYFKGEMHFSVKRRQAHWAQYVLLRAGVPLLHGYLDGSRADPAAARRAGAPSGPETGGGLFGWITGLIGLGGDQAAAEQPKGEAANSTAPENAGKLRVVVCDGSIADER